MKKKLLAVLTFSLFSTIGFTASATDSMHKSDKSKSGSASSSADSSRMSGQSADQNSSSSSSSPSSAPNQEKTIKENITSGKGPTTDTMSSIDANPTVLSRLSADPKVALFERMDTNRDGYLSNEELQAGRQMLVPDFSHGDTDQDNRVSLQEFKTVLSESMLGIENQPAMQNAQNTNAPGGQISEKTMREAEQQGGPTMLRGGPNPSPPNPTPEQVLGERIGGAVSNSGSTSNSAAPDSSPASGSGTSGTPQ